MHLLSKSNDNVSVQFLAFDGVENAEEILAFIRAPTPSGENAVPHMAVFDARSVPSQFALSVCTHRALCDSSNECMVTRSIYAEVLYNMAALKPINRAFAYSGLSAQSRCLISVLISASEAQVDAVRSFIKGQEIPVDEAIAQHFDRDRALRHYQIKAVELEGESSLENIIVSRIATRGI